MTHRLRLEKKDVLAFLWHLALFCIFPLFTFARNPGRLLIGNDGPMMVSLVREQLELFGVSSNLHRNILQGLSNLSFPINASLLPGFWFPLFDAGGHFTAAATYTWFAAMVFVCVLLSGWALAFRSISVTRLHGRCRC